MRAYVYALFNYRLFSLFNNEEENVSQNAELRQRAASMNSLLMWHCATHFSFSCLSFLVWGSGRYYKSEPKCALKFVMNKYGDWSNYHHYSGVQPKKSNLMGE